MKTFIPAARNKAIIAMTGIWKNLLSVKISVIRGRNFWKGKGERVKKSISGVAWDFSLDF